MKYDSFRYLWPPRPDSKQAVMPSMLPYFERQGYVAQIKKQGTCNVLAVSPDKQITAMNRHAEQHKLWTPTPASSAAFRNLPGQGWYVFVAELLHSKVAGGPRDTNYVFDILVAQGDYLVGKTFAERQAILMGLFPTRIDETPSHWVITPNTWLAKPITRDFLTTFQGLTSDLDEGIVMKNPRAPLELCSRDGQNTKWQAKCRRQHKNFGF